MPAYFYRASFGTSMLQFKRTLNHLVSCTDRTARVCAAQAIGRSGLCNTSTPGAGQSFSITKRFTEAEVAQFLALTGDANPLHTDPAAAQTQGFKAPLLPGILLASLFPGIIGSAFPGSVYASQTLSFRAAATVGEEVVATVVLAKRSGRRGVFETSITALGGKRLLVDGTALALLPQGA